MLSCRPQQCSGRPTLTVHVIHPLKTMGLLDPNGTVKMEGGRSWEEYLPSACSCVMLSQIKGDISNKQRDAEVYL